MTTSYGMDGPQALFTLQRPVDSTAGQTYSGLVHSINASRKRKRGEVVVGVDGESLNVYNVR